MNDKEWQRVAEWQRVVQLITTSDNELYNEWQIMTTSDNEWQWVTKNDNAWQWMTAIDKKILKRIVSKTEWF